MDFYFYRDVYLGGVVWGGAVLGGTVLEDTVLGGTVLLERVFSSLLELTWGMSAAVKHQGLAASFGILFYIYSSITALIAIAHSVVGAYGFGRQITG